MSLNKVCLTITEDASGANGPERLDRHARIESASRALTDWVYEQIVERRVQIEDEGLRVVQQLVARAMITMHDFDVAMALDILADPVASR